ncbi:hypothetical protein I3900191A7_13140 [Clostridium baratii]|uniref:hypothetical protein n=1 Tax=Clostridium baratii TaxID=1561 RepID=UPI0036F1ED6F
MESIKKYIQKHSKTIVIIDIILLISIGFGNSGILNGIVIFLLFLLLAYMPEEAFEDDEDKLKDENK